MKKTPKYYMLEATFEYKSEPSDEFTMDQTLDRVVDHLYDLDAQDVSVVANCDAGEFVLSHVVNAHPGESIETVLGRGMGTVRAAFHASEAKTHGWPDVSDMLLYVSVHPSREQVAVDDLATDTRALQPS